MYMSSAVAVLCCFRKERLLALLLKAGASRILPIQGDTGRLP